MHAAARERKASVIGVGESRRVSPLLSYALIRERHFFPCHPF
jgi:hypothetical protein